MSQEPFGAPSLSNADGDFLVGLSAALGCPPADALGVTAWLAREGAPGERLTDALSRRGLLEPGALRAVGAARRVGGRLAGPEGLFSAGGLDWLNRHLELSAAQRVAVPPVPGLTLGEVGTAPAEATVGRYRLSGPLGRGDAGVTAFEGRDALLGGDRVSIKILPTDTPERAARAADFARAADAAPRAPGCAPVLEVGRDFDCVYIVTPLSLGGTARERLEAGRVSPGRAAEWCAAAARALAALHDAGGAHGNVKAGNLLIGPEGVRLADPVRPADADLPAIRRADVKALQAVFAELASAAEGSLPQGFAPVTAGSFLSAADLAEALERLHGSLTMGQTMHGSRSTRKTVEAPAPPSVAREPRVGDEMGRCTLVARVGRGATGVVYRARHRTLGVDVAVKVLAVAGQSDDSFLAEARILARLNHPNIVRIWDFEAGGEFPPYLVLEWCEGDLGRLLAGRGVLSVADAVSLVTRAAVGMSAAHRQAGLIHRDLKPANILIGPGGIPKVADLGLASMVGSEAQAGADPIGTPAYMSPEHVRGAAAVDHRSDIYSLGATLYHAVTGRPPFEGRSRASLMLQHLREVPAPPRERNGAIPRWLSDVILRMLAKEPADRYQSWDALLEALGATPARRPATPHRQKAWPA